MRLARVAIGVAGLLLAVAVAAATLDQELATLKRDAGRVDPAELMLLSGKLSQAGRHDEALFWFLAGQLRMRYVLSVSPDETRGQAFASMMMALGMQIYPPFNGDGPRLAATVDRVLAWDRATPVDFSWLQGRQVLPREQWQAKFEPVRDGLVKLKAGFLAIPKDECERARQGLPKAGDKPQADAERWWNNDNNRKRVEEGYSTAPATVTTGGVAFRVAKNFLSPFAVRDAIDYKDRAIEASVFLPGLGGYTRENWADRLSPQRVQLGLLPSGGFSYMTTYAQQLQKAGQPLREVGGLRVYVDPKAHKCFPQELVAGEMADGEPLLATCTTLIEARPTCSAYFYGPGKRYTVSMFFVSSHLPQLREMAERVKPLVASWEHAAR